MNVIFLKQIQQSGNGRPAAENIVLICFQRALIQHPPEEFKIQLDNQRSGHLHSSLLQISNT